MCSFIPVRIKRDTITNAGSMNWSSVHIKRPEKLSVSAEEGRKNGEPTIGGSSLWEDWSFLPLVLMCSTDLIK